MKQFFKFLFASLLGHIIGGIILFFVFFSMLLGGLGDDKKQTKIVDNTVLRLEFSGPIKDRVAENPLAIAEMLQQQKPAIGLNVILDNLRKAKQDPRIKGIFLDLGTLSAGQATIEEIRNGLLDFKSSGKWIVSYSEVYSQSAYYLASVSDELYVYPEGGIDFKGFGAELMFFKNMFEKVNLEVTIIRGKNNRFKSAVEPFMYDHMSDANRKQTMSYLSSMWEHMVENISASRGIPVPKLNMVADSLMLRNAQDAEELGFADGVKYRDEIIALLKTKLSLEAEDEIEYTSHKAYTNCLPWKDTDGNTVRWNDRTKPSIAVIYAEGNIESGTGDETVIGSERIAKAIRAARLDTTMKAIVLRVNSPGGSALASDVMWREMELARAAKPVVVSMGDVAASGGYYISCNAHKIFASPNTITGSIGVFGVLPNIGNMLEEELGVNVDRIKTNNYSDLGSMTRAMKDDEYAIVQEGVEEVYTTFLTRVANGRNMQTSDVDSIGQGRVWSGTDAKQIGLIDEFGGLKKACDAAAELAGLDVNDYRVEELPELKDKLEELIKEIKGETEASIGEDLLGTHYAEYLEYRELLSLFKMEGVQARMPFVIRID